VKKPMVIKRNELISMVQTMEPDAVSVLHAIAGRLQMGRRQYGDLKIALDQRDWRKEAGEEALDMSVYLAIGLLAKDGI
jgi:hypothetical protein